VNPSDPFGNEDDFRHLQKRFTQYVRWGKVHEASVFVVEDQRQEFLSLAHELSDIRFTDYEITRLEYEKESAVVDVTLRGYRLTTPVERIVHLAQKWEKAEETGWQVRLDLAALESGLGGPQ
jgi:hypothetical protein